MKKIILCLIASFFAMSAMADWSFSYKKGAEGAWTYNVTPGDGGKVRVNLDANSTYYVYALVDGNGWASGDVTMTFGNSTNYDLTGYGDASYTELKVATAMAGEYVISLSWYDDKQHMTVEYPYAMYLLGSWNGWAIDESVRFSSSQLLTKHLTAGDYTFKARNNNSWYGNSGTMNGPQKGWNFESTIDGNCTIQIAEEGDYTFGFEWNEDKPRISVYRSNENAFAATTGVAREGFDGNKGSRWESAQTDDQMWAVRYTEPQTFDNVTITWEGAWGKTYDIYGSNDGHAWTKLVSVNEDIPGPFPYEQSIDLASTAVYQYVKFQGIKRGTGYGYSFFEFETLYKNVPIPTNVAVSATGRVSFDYEGDADSYVARIYDGVNLISSQEVVAGDVLRLASVTAKTYTVKMVAKVGENTSQESDGYAWTVAAGRVFGTSEFCNYHTNKMADNSEVALTWKTDMDGNVIIAISGYNSTTDVTYRGNGLGGDLSKFTVLSGDGFTTEVAASTYFTRQGGKDYDLEFKLVRNSTPLPYPCKIKMASVDMEWYVGAVGRWHNIDGMTYTYGTTCRVNEGMPGNVSVSATGRVLHDNVPGASKYAAVVIKDGAIVLQQDITSGAPLNWIPAVSGTYKVTVIAFDAEGNMFDVPAEADWTVEAGKVFGKSKYCDWLWNTTANEGWPVKMTWVTEINGNVTITLAPNGDQGDGETKFRGNGMPIDRFKVNGVDASTYFSAAWSDNVVTLTKSATPLNNGAIISYDGTVEYQTGTHTNAWPTLDITDYLYGTKCGAADAVPPVITTFEKVSATVDGMTFHVVASDEDDEGNTTALSYRISGNNDFAEQAVVLDGEGNFTISGLKKNIHYNFTLTAIDPAGNEATKDLENVDTEFDPNYNIALLKPCTGGYCQFSNHTPEDDARYHKRANDGLFDDEHTYSAFGAPEGEAWWQVDLGLIYVLSSIDIYYASDFSDNYQILGSFDGSNWFTMASDAAIAAGLKSTALVGSARYVKVFSVKRNVVFKEIEIFGTGFGAADSHAPEITTFEMSSVTTTTATFHVVASDVDDEGTPQPMTYSLAGDNGFVTTAVTPDGDGNFVVEGLKKNCDYQFTLTAMDPASNQTSFGPITVRMQFDAEDNLALNKPAEASAIQGDGVKAPKAVDGNTEYSNFWTPWGNGDANAWWKVDLGYIFELSTINIYWHERANNYTIYGSFTGVDDTWFPIITHAPATDNTKYELAVNAAARYLKLVANKNTITLTEFEVYGLGYATTDAVDPEVTVTKISTTTNSVTMQIDATDVDDADVAHPIRNIQISGDNDFVTIENAVLDGSNQIVVDGLKDNTLYHFTVTVTDRVGLTAEAELEVAVDFNTTLNLALNKPAIAGYYEAGKGAAMANDGDGATYWGTYGYAGDWEDLEANVWKVDLEETYSITRIVIKTLAFWGGNQTAIVESSLDGENWKIIKKKQTYTPSNTYEFSMVITARYLRITALEEHMFTVAEVEVYGNAFAVLDDQAPNITSATLVGGSVGEEKADVRIVANDNLGVDSCRFVDESHGFNYKYQVDGDIIHMFGLLPGTTYNFSVYACDPTGYESATPAVMSAFTTLSNTDVPMTPAPTPTHPAEDVISIYSNAYEPAVKDITEWQCWNNDAVVTHRHILGDDYVHYVIGATEQIGIGGDVNPILGTKGNRLKKNGGLTSATHAIFHIDIWSPIATTLGITIGDFDLISGYPLHEGWNQIDTALIQNVFANPDVMDTLVNLKWIKFRGMENKKFAVDNIYFYQRIPEFTDAQGDMNWADTRNWSNGALPTKNDIVYIKRACEVSTPDCVVKNLLVMPEGSLDIKTTGGLTVYDRLYNGGGANAIFIASSRESQGALAIANEPGTTKLTMQLYSEAVGTTTAKVFQYIGVPVSDMSDPYLPFYGSWMYPWSEANDGWAAKVQRGQQINPWAGYAIAFKQEGSETNHSFYIDGAIMPTGATPKVINLSHANEGHNLIANSWTAPIRVSDLRASDFVNAEATVYIYNTGSYAQAVDQQNAVSDGTSRVAGQWNSIPVEAASYVGKLTSIAPMQGFLVNANGAGASLNLDYQRVVMQPNGTPLTNEPLRAPRREAAADEVEVLRMTVTGSYFQDDVCLLRRSDFTTGFDNGWDGRKMYGDNGSAPWIYAGSTEGGMAVSAIPDFEGTRIGFGRGADELYTLTFDYSGAEPLYLYDVVTDTYTLISDETEYTFFSQGEEVEQRFLLTRNQAPGVATGISEVQMGDNNLTITNTAGDLLHVLICDAAGRVWTDRMTSDMLTHITLPDVPGVYCVSVEGKHTHFVEKLVR